MPKANEAREGSFETTIRDRWEIHFDHNARIILSQTDFKIEVNNDGKFKLRARVAPHERKRI